MTKLSEQLLTQNERGAIAGLISKLPLGRIDALCFAFREAFNVPGDEKVSTLITTKEHADWVREYIA